MKKALHKDFWMEIRKTRARFISIFCIVSLVVAFFSGIQASSPDMRMSGDAYYTENRMMDLKVMGTLGLTEEDIPWMAENCMKVSAASVANNPVVFTREEIAEIYRKAM